MATESANMKPSDVLDRARELFALLSEEREYVGIRFEDKAREVGEECECSRHNPDREDVREFPEFSSDGYYDLPEFDGTSCHDLSDASVYRQLKAPAYLSDRDAVTFYQRNHAYIIVGDRVSNRDEVDEGEIVIVDAEVAAVIY